MRFAKIFSTASMFAVLAMSMVSHPTMASDQESGPEWKSTTSLIAPSKYPPTASHYDYVNPAAPKGGTLNTAVRGTFDSFNPFIVRGESAAGLTYFGGLLWDTLMAQAIDEPGTSHPLIADAYKQADDYSWAIYRLDPRARWHDGKPITPEDVKWSMETLKEHSPQHTRYFANVQTVEILNDREVKFVFDQKNNRELPHIMGDLPVLPKHWWEGEDAEGNKRDFTRSTLEPPLGSGPYRISSFKAGSDVTWERVDDYWAKDTFTRKGRYNFDRRVYRYFGDDNALWQAFTKGGLEDIREENRAQRWAQEYNFPAFRDGKVLRRTFAETSSYPMVGWVLNQRREKFADRRVRKALSWALNFERMNEDLFFGQYNRLKTYFGGTEMSATGLPTGQELEILEGYRGRIPDEVFSEEFDLPVYKERRDERRHLRTALNLLKEAGFERRGTKMVNAETGEPLTFEILGYDPASERINAPWINNLRLLGIDATFRVVDTSQFIQRRNAFDYDVVVAGAYQSLSPGNEQRDYWSSDAADRDGSRNWFGVKDPVVDELVERIITAKDRAELIALTRALDRILLHSYLMVQQWYLSEDRVAWWDKFGMPENQPEYVGYDPESWWIDPQKAAALEGN